VLTGKGDEASDRQTLEGRVAVVTAAAGCGIGRAVATRFAQSGALVVLSDVHQGRLTKLHSELLERGFQCTSVTADVRDDSQVRALIGRALSEYGRIDILFNNAGVNIQSSVAEMSDEAWEVVIDVNLGGTFRTIRAALPAMIQAGFGSIINMTSYQAYSGAAGAAHYAAAKAGIIALTKSVAQEVAPKGIRVNAIAPGVVNNPFLAKAVPQSIIDQLVGNTPMGRAGSPDDIAGVAAFLASEDSRFVTGAVISVTGGLYMP
jgi:3-oxoacyl-[acyl-carrier protein] reductase